jgi:hypothetical protein
VLEKYAATPLDCAPFVEAHVVDVEPEDLDQAFSLRKQSDDRAQQNRFAATRTANEAENLTAEKIERQTIEDDGIAKANDKIPDTDDLVC